MKLTINQREVLKEIKKPCKHTKFHPKEQFDQTILQELIDLKCVVTFDYWFYWMGAVRITDRGKKYLKIGDEKI